MLGLFRIGGFPLSIGKEYYPHSGSFHAMFPIGWRHTGRDESGQLKRHEYCGGMIQIGVERGKAFKFCPKCLIKLDV